jgi:hypothetical protein
VNRCSERHDFSVKALGAAKGQLMTRSFDDPDSAVNMALLSSYPSVCKWLDEDFVLRFIRDMEYQKVEPWLPQDVQDRLSAF